MRSVTTAICLLIALCSSFCTSWAAQRSVLDLNDADAKKLLDAAAETGNMWDHDLAEAWIVLTTVALGVGIEKCHFPRGNSASEIGRPALKSLSPDDIFELNRIVTSNFRHAEQNGQLVLDRLFPVTRQAVLWLQDKKGQWNCAETARVFDAYKDFNENAKAGPPR